MSTAVRFHTTGILDPHRRNAASCHFEEALKQQIVGQDDSVRALAELYQVFCAGLNAPGRPVGNLLFLGPTGVGKTRVVEAAAEILFGDERAIIKVDCAEFQHSHEISKLIGSPPGYIGHRETHPLITQEALAKSHQGDLKLSFLLFDEIEKASDALWQLLLGILDVHVLGADGAAVRVAQHAQDVPQLHPRLPAEPAGGELALQVPQGQPVQVDVQVGVLALGDLERVGVGHQVAAHPVGVDQLLDPGRPGDVVLVAIREVPDPADRLVRDAQRGEDLVRGHHLGPLPAVLGIQRHLLDVKKARLRELLREGTLASDSYDELITELDEDLAKKVSNHISES